MDIKNSRGGHQTTGAAARLLCPYKLAQIRPLQSVLSLAVALPVIAIDVIFSKHILSCFNANALVFAVLLVISGFSVLRDIVFAKTSFSTSRPVVLVRLVSITACMLFTAAVLYASPFYMDHQAYVVLFFSAFRLFTPSQKHWYVPLVFGAVLLAVAIVAVKTAYNGQNIEIGPDRVFPIVMSVVTTIKDFIASRW